MAIPKGNAQFSLNIFFTLSSGPNRGGLKKKLIFFSGTGYWPLQNVGYAIKEKKKKRKIN
jgi:hypothetical protein